MEKITVFKCEYCGKLLNTPEECLKHEQRHRYIEGANEMLESGSTLEQINQRYNIWHTVPEHLKEATTNHCFKISYWQCCEKPAYRIIGIRFDGRLTVRGCGSWNGYYGNDLQIESSDLREMHPPEELYIDPRYTRESRWS